MGCSLAIVYLWRNKSDKFYRESPLTRELIRPPGHSLQQELNDLNDEVMLFIVFMFTSPLLLYSFHLSESFFGGKPESYLRTITSIVLSLVAISFFGRRLLRVLDKRKNLILGLQGEMFTGEELNQLMLHGCRVFHDIDPKYEYGNIDHVVVSPTGVYSINTKMRTKPKEGKGRAEVTVDHQKHVLRFMDREDELPTKQLETEASWLSKYLTSSVGNQIKVQPILALPGWYIKQKIGRGTFDVINPRNPNAYFMNKQTVLSPTEMQQISHQLEQLCRNIEPSFKEKKGWKAS